MAANGTIDPVLKRFRAKLEAAYGARLERVVLFGSRARGDHRPDSDYDVAVFIREPGSRWDEIGRLSQIAVEFLLENALLSAKPFPAERYWEETSFMQTIRRAGVEI